MDKNELRALLIAIYNLEAAGLLDEVREEIGHRLYPRPANPIDALTDRQRTTAEGLADTGSRLLDVPREDAFRVAVELFNPTRQQIAAAVVRLYAARLDNESHPLESQPESKHRQGRKAGSNES